MILVAISDIISPNFSGLFPPGGEGVPVWFLENLSDGEVYTMTFISCTMRLTETTGTGITCETI